VLPKEFAKIPGVEVVYKSHLELYLKGDADVIGKVKKMLVIENTGVTKQLQQLRTTHPRSPKHAQSIAFRIRELQESQFITPFAEIDDNTLSVPPGYWYLGEMVGKDNLSNIKAVTQGDERYYQKEIVEELLKYKRSSVCAATGIGKSLVLRNLAVSYYLAGKKVLICVPSIELLEQTAKKIDEGLVKYGAKCGRLGNGKKPKDGSRVVISTIQSAINICDNFDAVCFDEAHTTAAPTYLEVAAGAANAEYMHGLTATINRPDGLTPLIHAWSGPVVYNYDYRKAVKDEYLSPINYFQKMAPGVYPYVSNNVTAITQYIKLHSCPTYINYVAQVVKNSLDAGRKTLVLFKSNECCEALAKVMGCESASGEYRKPLYDFKAGKTNLLIANTILVGTGIDVPDISSIIFCAAGTSEIVFMQSMGRGTRLFPGKKDCIVVDVVPAHHKYIAQGNIRKAIVAKNITTQEVSS